MIFINIKKAEFDKIHYLRFCLQKVFDLIETDFLKIFGLIDIANNVAF